MKRLVASLLSVSLVVTPWLEAAAQVVRSAPAPVENGIPDAGPLELPPEISPVDSGPSDALSAPLGGSLPLSSLPTASPDRSAAAVQVPWTGAPSVAAPAVRQGQELRLSGSSAASGRGTLAAPEGGKPKTTESSAAEGAARFDQSSAKGPILDLPDPSLAAEPLDVGLARQSPAEGLPKAGRPEKILLVTGFEAFGGHASNSSEHVAAALDGRTLQAGSDRYRVVGRILPVSFENAGKALAEAVRELEPAAVLMFGMSGRTRGVEIETMAKNLNHSPKDADNDGARPVSSPIIPGAPAALGTNAPVKAIASALNAAGLSAKIWTDPSSFVCNSAFYEALYGASVSAARRLTALVHLPPATEHLSPELQKTANHWPLAELERSGTLIAEQVAKAAAKAPRVKEAALPLTEPRKDVLDAQGQAAPVASAKALLSEPAKPPFSWKSLAAPAAAAAFGAAAIGAVRWELLHGLALPFWSMVGAYALPGAAIAAAIAFSFLKPERQKWAAAALAGVMTLGTLALMPVMKAHGFFPFGLAASLATMLLPVNAMKSIEFLIGRSTKAQRGAIGQKVPRRGEPSQILLLNAVFGTTAVLAALTGGTAGLAACVAVSVAEMWLLNRLKKRRTEVPARITPDPLPQVVLPSKNVDVEKVRAEFEAAVTARDPNILAVWTEVGPNGPYFEAQVLDASPERISKIAPNVEGIPVKVVAVPRPAPSSATPPSTPLSTPPATPPPTAPTPLAAAKETPAGNAATLVQTVADVSARTPASKPDADEALEEARTMLYLVAGGSADSGHAGLAKLTVQQRIEYFGSREFKDWVSAEKARGKKVYWLKDIDGTQAAGDVFTFFFDWRARNGKFTREQNDALRTFLRSKVKLSGQEKAQVEKQGPAMNASFVLDLWKEKRIDFLSFWNVYWSSQTGMTKEEKLEQVRDFIPEYAARVFPETAADNRALRDAGVEVVFVTNGDEDLARAAAPMMGNDPDHVVGSRLLYVDGVSLGRPHTYDIEDETWAAKPQPGKFLNYRFWLHENKIDGSKAVVAGFDGDSAAADGGAMIYLEPAVGNFMVATPGDDPRRLEAFEIFADKYGAWERGRFITLQPRPSEKGPLP